MGSINIYHKHKVGIDKLRDVIVNFFLLDSSSMFPATSAQKNKKS